MLLRTHLALSVLIVIIFLPHVTGKSVFILTVLVATMIPDIDSGFSTLGKGFIFRIVQFFVKHRGIFHSLTFCVLASALLAIFLPTLSLGFFLGYSFHLLLDSFTVEGITPFWPWNRVSKGVFKTGGRVETSLFVFFVIADFLAAVIFIKGV